MAKFLRDPQNVIAVGVTLISVCALIVSITQTRIMVKQNEMMDLQARAAVRPIITYRRDRGFNPETEELLLYRMSLVNNGVGPAEVDSLSFQYEGQKINGWWHFFALTGVPDSIPKYTTTESVDVIQAGTAVTFLDLTDNLQLARYLYQKLDSAVVRVHYHSIYGDRYVGEYTPEEGWRSKKLNTK